MEKVMEKGHKTPCNGEQDTTLEAIAQLQWVSTDLLKKQRRRDKLKTIALGK